MTNLLDGIEEILLMGPGPSCVSDSVYDALSKKTLGHLDPYFIRIMDAIKEQLQSALSTKNALTVPMSGTGSAGMETCFVNLVEPGDSVLVLDQRRLRRAHGGRCFTAGRRCRHDEFRLGHAGSR